MSNAVQEKGKETDLDYYHPKCPICGKRMVLIWGRDAIFRWFCEHCQKSWVKEGDSLEEERFDECPGNARWLFW